MKKFILFFFVITCVNSYAQKFVVSPEGLRNAENNELFYVVLEVNETEAKQLYDNAFNGFFKEINDKYDFVIEQEIPGEYVKYQITAPKVFNYTNSGNEISLDARYTTELEFRDGLVRFEIISLEIKESDSKKELQFEKAKTEIENYFNNQVEQIQKYLKE